MDLKTIPCCVVLLAGGTGSRMQSATPKQYLLLQGKPVVIHSFEVFLAMNEVSEIVIVCEEPYESLFYSCETTKKISFARPGARRQDSVFSGLQKLNCDDKALVCIHDAARPVINSHLVRKILRAAEEYNAAVLGVKVKSTIKVCDENQFVVSTLDRASLWEIQTPQVIRLGLLKLAFDYVHEHHLTVTDDASLVELLNKPVKIVEGSYQNMKLTTSEDIILIQQLLEKNDLL